MPADAIAYVGFNDLAGTITTILEQAKAAQSSDTTAQQLDALAGQLPQLLGGVGRRPGGPRLRRARPGRDLRQADPRRRAGGRSPDGAKATATLDALRVGIPTLLETFSPQTKLPAWKQVPLAAGVKGWRLPLSPEAGAVYGVDGDLAIIGTSVPAVTAVQRPVSPLSDSADFTTATSGMPDKVTSVFWLNISEVVDAADKLGALKDVPADTLANLRPLKSISAWTTGGDTPTFEVFLRESPADGRPVGSPRGVRAMRGAPPCNPGRRRTPCYARRRRDPPRSLSRWDSTSSPRNPSPRDTPTRSPIRSRTGSSTRS